MQEIGQSAGKSFAYLVGVYLGDGCVTNGGGGYPVFRLNTIDADFAKATKESLAALTARPVNINVHAVKKSLKPNHSLRCGDPDICRTLVTMTEKKTVLPQVILEASREERLAFVAGLMDSEGFVGATSNPTNRRYYMGYKSCDVWVPTFIRLLEQLGVRIGKVSQEQPLKPWYKIPTRFTIKMQSWIDAGCYFNIMRKQERVLMWAEAGAYERRSPRRLTSETNMPNPREG